MLKFTDVNVMIQKKISRNKIMYEIFDLCQKINSIEITIKEKIITHYDAQKQLLDSINKIELLQCNEYKKEREEKINDMMKLVGDISLLDIDEFNKERDELKEQIKYKKLDLNQLQELIPKEGVATNYTVHTNDANQTCSKASQII